MPGGEEHEVPGVPFLSHLSMISFNGCFTLPDSDSDSDSESFPFGYNLATSLHCTDSDSGPNPTGCIGKRVRNRIRVQQCKGAITKEGTRASLPPIPNQIPYGIYTLPGTGTETGTGTGDRTELYTYNESGTGTGTGKILCQFVYMS